MKELKSFKNHKKKPGEFQKSKKKHKNIQHNRDQLKLLKEEKIEQAELFILDPDAFKKVTIERGFHECFDVVYLSNHGRKSKLRTGTISCKTDPEDGRVQIVGVGYLDVQYCYGHIVKVEILKTKEPDAA